MTRRHHGGGIQEYAAHMIERLGGFISGGDPKHAAPEPEPAADVWGDAWARQHSRKAGER